MSFEELRIHPHLLRSVKELGFEVPTPVQKAAIPLLLQGSDVIAQAQTGTGKTAAFAIAILQTLQPGSGVQAIILVPTRELALQVVQEFRDVGKYCRHRTLAVYGGASMNIHGPGFGPLAARHAFACQREDGRSRRGRPHA
ncbi:DEAD/DEAH box helicase [Candidatus Micrarchaeota archaeon]|nr:DEAD/DEAH box helicase [Candidatus Micrarchaeota archaeon]